MRRLLGRAVVGFVVALAALLPTQGPAFALAHVSFTGSGGFSPGLTLNPAPQSWWFNTTFAIGQTTKPAANAGLVACSLSGPSTGPETIATGQGLGSGMCSGAVSAFCVITYSRVGSKVFVTGACSVGGIPQGITGVFEFTPTSYPTTSYFMSGSFSLI